MRIITSIGSVAVVWDFPKVRWLASKLLGFGPCVSGPRKRRDTAETHSLLAPQPGCIEGRRKSV